ncbi:benzoate 4-monooxygenase cytochrome-like protein P450 [Pseudovirgaria hyperparasitica]|uniref:Benzoate 4-monooxygenase cytochrome-like protein P450 n=1 Tax=Pseudovirgaria hyperparasitica TaxID=470096 RepID=A0A6A6W5J1_9PEZI|nr:benzoate 4-monooxygenase cytochrome-like protein P450 [Pseudovirgaria hyperparasitica]KAF2757815.1 benzoate 4-monooxygenase cytochrome-like protein P450 [Pseudovirgaria hyperparasitica]
MIVNDVVAFASHHWFLISSILVPAYFVWNKYQRGLSKYPGPWLASYTDLWRFSDALGRKPEQTHIRLHKELGDIVRLAPNVLSFADPKAIKSIYGLNKGFVKSDFYPVQQATSKGRRLPSLFSTTDEDYHAKYRRCVNSAFAMSSLVSYEPLVNSTLTIFLDQTERLYVQTNRCCNFSQWLQFFAFDVIGDLTWSKRLGFVEKNEDVDGVIAFLFRFLSYAGPVGQMPIIDLLLEKNPLKLLAERWGLSKNVFPITQFALSRSQERAVEMQKIKENGLPADASGNKGGVDLLSKFNAAAHDHPQFMTDTQVLTSCVSMVFAGSETTAISLSAVFYYLLRNPIAYNKLMAELDAAVLDGTIESRDNGLVSWSESQKLPYLDAVIQESFRLHPAAGLLLERVVPAKGITICDEHIPGGTIVGCNAWVLHRRPEVFGEDVDAFRPERWIDAKPEKLRDMKATMFHFGAGARTCIGRNISLLEVYKLVPSFLRRFEIELDQPEKEWVTDNGWFVRQLAFNTKFKLRVTLATV